jgi:hypothetical protein
MIRSSGACLFDLEHPHRSSSGLEVIENFRTVEDDVDAASLWTQRTRPQGTWKTAKSAVSHSAHIDHSFSWEEEERREEKNTATQPSTKSDQVQRPPDSFKPKLHDPRVFGKRIARLVEATLLDVESDVSRAAVDVDIELIASALGVEHI